MLVLILELFHPLATLLSLALATLSDDTIFYDKLGSVTGEKDENEDEEKMPSSTVGPWDAASHNSVDSTDAFLL